MSVEVRLSALLAIGAAALFIAGYPAAIAAVAGGAAMWWVCGSSAR